MTKQKSWPLALYLALSMIFTLGSIPSKSMVLHRTSTPYNGELTVLDHDGVRYLIAQASHGELIQSAMSLAQRDLPTSPYLQVMAILASLHPEARQIFNIGLGGGELPRFKLSTCADCQVDSVEIDPKVIELARKYFYINHPKHRVLEGEGFDTLKRQSGRYDLIWVDATLPKEGPRAYMKAEYLNVLQKSLSEKGVIIAHLGSAKAEEQLAEVESGYRRKYSNGIRIKAPVQDAAQAIRALGSLISSEPQPSMPLSQSSSYVIAVGNQPSLNCRQFWSTYRAWLGKKTANVKWDTAEPAETSELCQELK
jgi:predicted O-methyltransferase YrrM